MQILLVTLILLFGIMFWLLDITPYGIYISELARYARGCCEVVDLNERNLCITLKLLSQAFRYHT